jgi:hypothetical protein
MGRNESSNMTGFHVRAKVFPKITTKEEVLRHSVNGKVFYAQDLKNLRKTKVQLGDVILRNTSEVTICTVDLSQADIERDCKVLYENKYYQVSEVEFVDSNQQKDTCARSNDILTIIKLV